MKDFLTSLVPWYYRLAAIVAALGVAYSAGWMNAHVAAEKTADELAASAKAADDITKTRLALDAVQQRNINASNGGEYAAAIHGIHSFYADCLRNNDCPGKVPAVSGCTGGIATRPADAVPVANVREQCAVTTQMFVSLRKAWREQRDSHRAIYGN